MRVRPHKQRHPPPRPVPSTLPPSTPSHPPPLPLKGCFDEGACCTPSRCPPQARQHGTPLAAPTAAPAAPAKNKKQQHSTKAVPKETQRGVGLCYSDVVLFVSFWVSPGCTPPESHAVRSQPYTKVQASFRSL